MKGIVLAGGSGSRLLPITSVISKQLLPVYDKPMICYPLSVLMLLGITDILIISTPRDLPHIEGFLGDGSRYGISLSYAQQDEPKGIAEAFLIGEEFLDGSPVCLMLGDNILHTAQLASYLKPCTELTEGAVVLTHKVNDPERFGIAEMGTDGTVKSLEEKPEKPRSNWAVIGTYFYDGRAAEYTKRLTPSPRGELEITDLNKLYLKKNQLKAFPLGRGTAWMDAGTPESLNEASNFVRMLETSQRFKIACLEEVAFRKKFISRDQFAALIESYPPSSNYHAYLKEIYDEHI